MKQTQLHGGSLDGLRRQVNECLKHAYEAGYKEGYGNAQATKEEYGRQQYEEGYHAGLLDKEGVTADDIVNMLKYAYKFTSDFQAFLKDKVYGQTLYIDGPLVSIIGDLLFNRDIIDATATFNKHIRNKQRSSYVVGDIVSPVNNVGSLCTTDKLVITAINPEGIANVLSMKDGNTYKIDLKDVSKECSITELEV